MSNVFTDTWEALKQAEARAKAEELSRNKLLHYFPKHLDSCSHSPIEFYELVMRNLDWRKVPDLTAGVVWLRERHFISNQRLYLQLKRERLVFEICAAPFGTGYFVSSRLFDRRRSAKPLHYLLAFLALLSLGLLTWSQYGWTVGSVVIGIMITGLCSLMRLAVLESGVWLDEKICEVPILGPIYESLFHPDTYYRQDTNQMYIQVVNKAFSEAIANLMKLKGIKLPGEESGSFVDNLSER